MKSACVFVGLSLLGLVVAPTSADNPYILVSGYESNNVTKLDAVSGAYLGTLISGGGLYSPEGLAIAADGTLLVASAASHEIQKYDLNSGAYLGIFASGSGLQYPRGITFGPDANLYVSSWYPACIKRFDGQTGSFIDDFVPPGTEYYGRSNEIIFRGDGMYASIGDNSPVVVRHDAITGELQGVFAGGMELSDAQGFAFGPDGDLYLADTIGDAVRRYDGQSGAYKGDFVPAGSGGLDGPEDIIFNLDGSMLVTSALTAQVLRYDGASGEFLGEFGSTGLLPTYMLLVPEPASFLALTIAMLAIGRRR